VAAAAAELGRSAAEEAMAEGTNTRTKRRWRRIGGSVLLLAVALGVGGPIWITWPKRTSDRFVAHVSGGRFGEAKELLADPSAIRQHENGDVTLTAADGSSVTLTGTDLPLLPLDDFYSRPARDGVLDIVAGRYQFEVATAGEGVRGERTEPIEVQMDAVRGAVVIVRIIRH
jgi:hypothetical protein